jgi:hypothetical protein
MDFSGQVMNELFLEKVASENTKVSEAASNYIRTRLREESFSRKIMRPEYVTKADCQRSVNHDQLVKIVDIEPNSKAMALNFRGRPDAKYIMGERYEIPFYKVSTEDYQKQEEELLAYEMPILDLIERNAVLDIQAIEDETFIRHVNVAINASSKDEVYTGPGEWTAAAIDRHAFVQLFNKLANAGGTFAAPTATSTYTHDFTTKSYKTDCILMNEYDFNLMLDWAASTAGDQWATKVTIDGYQYATLFGRKIIVTNKGSLVPRGYMYAFAAKEYFGHAYVLNDTKFFIEKRKDIITWSAYESIGIGFGNTAAMARIFAQS